MGGAQGVHRVVLANDAEGWFSGARLEGVADANLAHHVAHVPEHLAAARHRVGELTGTDPTAWHLMRQTHGAGVAVVNTATQPGAELRGVDVIVTDLPERALVVLSADCVPILAAGRRAVGAAHAGWRGVVAGVPDALVSALSELGEQPQDITVALGPSIGPCCYAVGPEVIRAVAEVASDAVGATRDGHPSVDLRAAVRTRLAMRGVDAITDSGHPDAADASAPPCTSCDAGWFSHRRDPSGGRQAGIVVRRAPAPGLGS